MTVSFDGSNSIFQRLGKLFDFAKGLRVDRTAVRTKYEEVTAEFTNASGNSTIEFVPALLGSVRAVENTHANLMSFIRSDASNVLIEMVDADKTLDRKNVREAILELTKQMRDESTPETVDRPSSGYVTLPTDGKGTASSSNTGDGIFVVSDMAKVGHLTNALVFDMPSVRTDTLRTTVLRDSNYTNVLETNEVYEVRGDRPVGTFDAEWPKGSGLHGTGVVVSASRDHGSVPGENVLANSDFEEFDSNVPIRWTRVAGTAGTHVELVADPFRGTNALKLSGDGSTNPNIKQNLDDQTASAGQLYPDCAYTICAAVKRNATAPGVSLIISLRDSGGTILNNEVSGRACTLNVATGDITTSYQLFVATVFTPVRISSGVYADIRFSGNVTNNSEVFVDEVTIAKMYQPGSGQLYHQMISGAAAFREQDEFSTAITNNCAATDGEIALEFERFFQIGRMGLVLPSATSPTIVDSANIT